MLSAVPMPAPTKTRQEFTVGPFQVKRGRGGATYLPESRFYADSPLSAALQYVQQWRKWFSDAEAYRDLPGIQATAKVKQ